MTTLITNCRIVSPGIDFAPGAILIENGTIRSIFDADSPLPEAEKMIDGSGLMALPGFVDIHCHGRNNFDFSDASDEGVRRIAHGKLEEGVTTLLPTTLTLPEEQLRTALETIARYDGGGCKMPAVHLEGPFINAKCCGAQNPAFVRPPDLEEVRRLNAIYPVKKISFAAELEGAVSLTAELLRMGIVPSCVHSAAKYGDFNRCYRVGMRNLSHFCNQMTPLHHRDIGLVGAGLLEEDVFLEFICDKLHICPDMIALVFKIKGPDRIQLISDAMRASGMPDGEYTLGGLPVIAKDGAARLKEGGALAGSVLQLNVALKNVAEITKLPLSELVKSTSYTQARALGLSGIGKIEPGFRADIVLLDAAWKVRKTLVDGEVRFEAHQESGIS